MSKASDVAAAFAARLATITVANGFATDIGNNVLRGKPNIYHSDEDSDLPCIILAEAEDRVEDQKPRTGLVKLAQRYVFEGHDLCNPDHPNDKAHLVLADLKRAIFGQSFGDMLYELRYVGRAIGARPDGTAIVAASIEVEAVYSENLTNP